MGSDSAEKLREPQNRVAFDFGGGTRDVAVFRVGKGGVGAPVAVSSLSVSRRHRLGGGDLDRAVVEDVPLPALIEQYGPAPFEPGYAEN